MAAIEELLTEAGDLPRSKILETLDLSESRFTRAVDSSERIWQPGGPRTPYSVTPKEVGVEQSRLA
jgi:hypothetical protein